MTLKPQKQMIRFTRAAVMNPIIAYLENSGVVMDEYPLQAGLPPGSIDGEFSPIPATIICNFINAACRKHGIED